MIEIFVHDQRTKLCVACGSLVHTENSYNEKVRRRLLRLTL